ncbi:MAG: hypothetical protein AB7L09_01735 [Nitrospira sp.]
MADGLEVLWSPGQIHVYKNEPPGKRVLLWSDLKTPHRLGLFSDATILELEDRLARILVLDDLSSV